MDPLYVGGAVFAAGIIARGFYSACCSDSGTTAKANTKKNNKKNKKKNQKYKEKRAKETDDLSSFISSSKTDEVSTVKRRRNKKKKVEENSVEKVVGKKHSNVPETKQKSNSKNKGNSSAPVTETKQNNSSNNTTDKKTARKNITNDAGEWSVVPSEKKKKRKNNNKKTNAAANLNSEGKEYILINTKQIGILIGPGGKNLQAIQAGTNTRINVPRNPQGSTTNVEIEGLGMNINNAKNAIRDLMNKGYCSHTIDDDFYEDHIMVHPMYFPDIIGKNGAVIRKIQDDVGAKLNIPKNTNMNSNQRSRVMITGSKANVRQAKDVVYSIMQFYHHEITHPGVTHVELHVAEWQRQTLIGPKGSTIKHIQGNWGVNVCLPNENSLNANTLVVGLPKNVDGAKKYILKILSDADEAQTSYEQESSLGGDWGAGGNDDDNGWGSGW